MMLSACPKPMFPRPMIPNLTDFIKLALASPFHPMTLAARQACFPCKLQANMVDKIPPLCNHLQSSEYFQLRQQRDKLMECIYLTSKPICSLSCRSTIILKGGQQG